MREMITKEFNKLNTAEFNSKLIRIRDNSSTAKFSLMVVGW